MAKQVKETSLGEFEVLVLTGVLAAGEGAYGMVIHEEVERLVEASRNVSLGAVYTTLDRLQEKGYLSSSYSDPTPERGGRTKRIFEVSAAGKKALTEALIPMRNVLKTVKVVGG